MAKPSRNEAVHVGFDYAEAVSAKKVILLCETNLLEVMKRMAEYNSLRRREFILKNRLRKDLIEIKDGIAKIETELPKSRDIEPAGGRAKSGKEGADMEITSLMEMHREEARKKRLREAGKRKSQIIEAELDEIKAKLNALG